MTIKNIRKSGEKPTKIITKNGGKITLVDIKNIKKNYILIKKYGITIEHYNQLFLEQGGRCGIYNRHQSEFKRNLAVDHSHDSGEVRGLLCHHCNRGLGHFFEDVSVMEKAISYLKNKNVKKI